VVIFIWPPDQKVRRIRAQGITQKGTLRAPTYSAYHGSAMVSNRKWGKYEDSAIVPEVFRIFYRTFHLAPAFAAWYLIDTKR
jgi:hypothetical protein